MNRLWKLWGRSIDAISLRTRLRIYDVYALAILLYNVEAAALADSHIAKLEQTHRRHLRRLACIFWPARISNVQLYAKAQTKSIRTIIITRRLEFLAKILRQPRLYPARESMEQYFRHLNEAPSVRGRPLHMPQLLSNLFELTNENSLRTWGDFEVLRGLANASRQHWRDLITNISRRDEQRIAKIVASRRRAKLIADAIRGRSKPETTIADLQDERGKRKSTDGIAHSLDGTGTYRYRLVDGLTARHDNVLLFSRDGKRIRLTHSTIFGAGHASPQLLLGSRKRKQRAAKTTKSETAADPSTDQTLPNNKRAKTETADQKRVKIQQQLEARPGGQEQRGVRQAGQSVAVPVDLYGREEMA
jgi:hypothetical protein